MKTLYSIIILCCLLLSCVSTKINKTTNLNETTNQKSIGALEPNIIITGVGESGEEKIYTNPYLIAGIVPNNKPIVELLEILEELELEGYQPYLDTLSEIALRLDAIGTTETFVLIKKKNSEPFSQKDSPALGILRQKFRRFGPIHFNSQKQIQGVFDHRIEVLVKRTEKEFPIDSIAKKYSGEIETFSYVDLDILYRIKLSQDIGNEIVEIAKEISTIPEIISATPKNYFIINGNP
jgi:hypothetical protein